MTRPRLRDLGINIGSFPPGPHNAITDVPGVSVGHTTVIHDEPRIARTGVTVILPRESDVGRDHCFAGFHSFNGNGEMTGTHWLKESGLLVSPIALTSTHYVGIAHQALVEYSSQHGFANTWSLPVVAETYDGFLNDADAMHLKPAHVLQAIKSASAGAVAEGNVGGGTGMVCHEFKGGIGTSSRVVPTDNGPFTVGVLVQANYGLRRHLRVDGAPIGARIPHEVVPVPNWKASPITPTSSIIIVIATDAPLLPGQCDRLAQRATVGLSRVGGVGFNGSGDLFLAFSTANHVPNGETEIMAARWLPHAHMNPLFEGVAEATEEAILNALCAAETMTGHKGRMAVALPTDRLVETMRAGRL